MTENKRFTLSYTYGILDNGEQMEDLSNVCECLNELHEEKEDLVTQKEDLAYELLHLKEKYEELLKEKEELIDALNQRTEQCDKLHEENQALKEKIDIMADAFTQSNDLIEIEQVFYTKVYEPSEYYDEETLSEITNALLGSDGE